MGKQRKQLTGISDPVSEKFEKLQDILSGYGRCALAYSGGVDSAFLLAAAVRAEMDKVLAVTITSRFFTRAEVQRAKDTAKALGADHVILDLDILSDSRVARNDEKRCYYCKQNGFSAIKAVAEDYGIKDFIHGINMDDLKDYRPGIAAAKELGFKAPLVEAEFTKAQIREASRALELSTWDLPSQSCLATRIPRGTAITPEDLEKVEAAEHFLHDLGFAQVRVRCHGSLARIEVPQEIIPDISAERTREKISVALKSYGFAFISLDLDGYASGKMNVETDEP